MIGPGKYDDICTRAREAAGPDAEAVLLIANGFAGEGFSVQASLPTMRQLPRILRTMADQIEQDLKAQET